MDKLLVIGSSGILGSRVFELAKGDFDALGTYNKHSVEGKNLFRLDTRIRADVFKIIERLKPDLVIDTHGLTNLDYCETHWEEAWQINVEGTKNVAEACKKFQCRYTFISTDYVFDGKKASYAEEDETHGLNYYARTKIIAERTIMALDIDYIIARTTVLYGLGGIEKTSFPIWLIGKLRNNENVKVVNDQKNNPTFTDNLSAFLFSLYKKNANGIFHITGRDCISRYDFAREIAYTFGLDGELIIPTTSEGLGQIALRPKTINFIVDKVEKATGIRAVGVKEGLSLMKKQLIS